MLWVVVRDGASQSLNFPLCFESERPKGGTAGSRAAAWGMKDGEAGDGSLKSEEGHTSHLHAE